MYRAGLPRMVWNASARYANCGAPGAMRSRSTSTIICSLPVHMPLPVAPSQKCAAPPSPIDGEPNTTQLRATQGATATAKPANSSSWCRPATRGRRCSQTCASSTNGSSCATARVSAVSPASTPANIHHAGLACARACRYANTVSISIKLNSVSVEMEPASTIKRKSSANRPAAHKPAAVLCKRQPIAYNTKASTALSSACPTRAVS